MYTFGWNALVSSKAGYLQVSVGVSEGVAPVVCCLQPIKIKLRQNQVESAIMCQIKTEHNVGLVRVEAMHKRTPVFTFMFGRDGNLLNSCAAAMTKFGVKSVGRAFTLPHQWPIQ